MNQFLYGLIFSLILATSAKAQLTGYIYKRDIKKVLILYSNKNYDEMCKEESLIKDKKFHTPDNPFNVANSFVADMCNYFGFEKHNPTTKREIADFLIKLRELKSEIQQKEEMLKNLPIRKITRYQRKLGRNLDMITMDYEKYRVKTDSLINYWSNEKNLIKPNLPDLNAVAKQIGDRISQIVFHEEGFLKFIIVGQDLEIDYTQFYEATNGLQTGFYSSQDVDSTLNIISGVAMGYRKGKQVYAHIIGHADALPVKENLIYKGDLGSNQISFKYIDMKSTEISLSLTKNHALNNEQLGALRAYNALWITREYFNDIEYTLKAIDYSSHPDYIGMAYRKVEIKLLFLKYFPFSSLIKNPEPKIIDLRHK
jgi:hypothetical protein